MRFFADECIDMRVARALEAEGHEIVEPHRSQKGAPDLAVLASASEQDCILLTADGDLGRLLFVDGLTARGVFYLRSDDPDTCLKGIRDHLGCVEGAIVVVSDRAVRVRPLAKGPLE